MIDPSYLNYYEECIRTSLSEVQTGQTIFDPSLSALQMVEKINNLSSNPMISAYKIWLDDRSSYINPYLGKKMLGYYQMDGAFVRDMLDAGVFSELETLRFDRHKNFRQYGAGVALTFVEIYRHVESLPLQFPLLNKFEWVVRLEESSDFDLYMRSPRHDLYNHSLHGQRARTQILLGNPRGASKFVSYWRPDSKFLNVENPERYGSISYAPEITPSYIGKRFYNDVQEIKEKHGRFLFFEILQVHEDECWK